MPKSWLTSAWEGRGPGLVWDHSGQRESPDWDIPSLWEWKGLQAHNPDEVQSKYSTGIRSHF